MFALQEFLNMLKLEANEKVLDVGCGIGGGDFLMAEKYDTFVHGMDLSVNMVLIALERASQAKRSKVLPPPPHTHTCIHYHQAGKYAGALSRLSLLRAHLTDGLWPFSTSR